MREYTGKKNGKAFKGIYTNSCMPNQKLKRVRKTVVEENPMNNIKVNINLFGVFGAIVTAMQAPLTTGWKIGLAVLFFLASIHAEVENNE